MKNIPGIFFVCTIRSYLLWSPVIPILGPVFTIVLRNIRTHENWCHTTQETEEQKKGDRLRLMHDTPRVAFPPVEGGGGRATIGARTRSTFLPQEANISDRKGVSGSASQQKNGTQPRGSPA